jgi:D-glycero-alpha-D-manno-heptose-7-phosphate kinase
MNGVDMSIVVARAPARVSLAGGGTDLPAYYERSGGAVVSFAITQYAYAQASSRTADLEIVSLDAGVREVIPQAHFARRVRPPILAEEFLLCQKAVAWHFGIDRGRLAASSEVPTGAGLASSGSIMVSLVQAAARFVGDDMDRGAIAETACRIEMGVLQRACGKQDQYASAFGGVNLIEFFRDGSVDVTPLRISADTLATLEARIMLFHNGSRRSSVGVLQEQARRSSSDPDTMTALDQLKDMAYQMREALEGDDLDRVGQMLHEGWQAKQHLNSQLSTPEFTRVYALARSAGAIGGKLAGAGIAGTLVLYCPEERQDEVRMTLATQGWRERRMRIDHEGVSLCADVGADNDLVPR